MGARCCRDTRSESPRARAVAPALASALIVDALRADRRSLACFAVPPQVRAEVGHVWIIGRGPARIKRANYSVIPWNCSIHCRLWRLPETSDMLGSRKGLVRRLRNASASNPSNTWEPILDRERTHALLSSLPRYCRVARCCAAHASPRRRISSAETSSL
jgi:hypothetical protein